MKVIIAGAGRMGQRHAQGIAGIKEIECITLADIMQQHLKMLQRL
jgi:hypothetical protein